MKKTHLIVLIVIAAFVVTSCQDKANLKAEQLHSLQNQKDSALVSHELDVIHAVSAVGTNGDTLHQAVTAIERHRLIVEQINKYFDSLTTAINKKN